MTTATKKVTFEEIYELFKVKPPRPAGGFRPGSVGNKIELKLDHLCRQYKREHGYTFWSEYYRRVEQGSIPLQMPQD